MPVTSADASTDYRASEHDLRTLACAKCRRTLLGESMRRYRPSTLPPIPFVAGTVGITLECGRVHHRPVCASCLARLVTVERNVEVG